MFQPVHRLAVELLLDCDVGHRRRWRRSVPVLFAWREPDDVTGSNLLDRPTRTLGAANAGCARSNRSPLRRGNEPVAEIVPNTQPSSSTGVNDRLPPESTALQMVAIISNEGTAPLLCGAE
jgi:hypothetical protein